VLFVSPLGVALHLCVRHNSLNKHVINFLYSVNWLLFLIETRSVIFEIRNIVCRCGNFWDWLTTLQVIRLPLWRKLTYGVISCTSPGLIDDYWLHLYLFLYSVNIVNIVRFLNRSKTKLNVHERSHLSWELPSKTEWKVEGREKVTGRRVRRHKQLLDFLKYFFTMHFCIILESDQSDTQFLL
jgi:hypothetical protein